MATRQTGNEGDELVHRAIVQLKVDAVRRHFSIIRYTITNDTLSTFDELLWQAWIRSVSKIAKQQHVHHDRALDEERAKLKAMIGVLFQHGYRASSSLYLDFVRMAEYELAESLLRYPLNEAMDAVNFEKMLIGTDWQFSHDPKAQHLLEVLVDKVIVPNLHRDHARIRYVLEQRETTDFCYDLLERKLWSREEMRARKAAMRFLSSLTGDTPVDQYLREPNTAADIVSYIGSASPPKTKRMRTESGGTNTNKKTKTRTNSRNRGISPRPTRRRRSGRCGKR